MTKFDALINDEKWMDTATNSKLKVVYGGRYRDDMLLIIFGSESDAQLLLNSLNEIGKNIQFTMEWGGEEFTFFEGISRNHK